MGGEIILPDLATFILIPLCAVIGIAFSLVQWILVSRVKVSDEKRVGEGDGKNGFTESLIEEEEGNNDHNVVRKCADIQNAISEGLISIWFSNFLYKYMCRVSDRKKGK